MFPIIGGGLGMGGIGYGVGGMGGAGLTSVMSNYGYRGWNTQWFIILSLISQLVDDL